jgi:tRNA A58 N-methylase Trm61
MPELGRECVLDIGCGMGDVAMIIAQLVGSAGRVVSIDLDHASIETAQRRASNMGLDNTTFYRADISTFTSGHARRSPTRTAVSEIAVTFDPTTLECAATCMS